MAFVVNPLTPYAGPFDRAAAWHLLRRACFGATRDKIDAALSLGLTGTLDRLMQPDAPTELPLNERFTDDPQVPIGSTWIAAPRSATTAINGYRNNSMLSWQVQQYHGNGLSVHKRMWLFWQNHFAVSRNGDIRSFYYYLQHLLDNSLGSFPDLVKFVAADPQMLGFLNGNQNSARSPNENFARELLELFTIGKGPLVGSGDYTTYTEDDIRAMARALTGWIIATNSTTGLSEGRFNSGRHDKTDKTLSHRFDNAVITNANELEMNAVIDLIFARPDAGVNLCRKLYRWFVYYDITPQIEIDIIAPLAAAFRAANYNVAVPVRMLLASEHFFEQRFRGALVKSPLEHVLDIVVPIEFPLGDTLVTRYAMWRRMSSSTYQQDMILWDPGSVAGYRAYYQAPTYNRAWLSSPTLQVRSATTRSFALTSVTLEGTRYTPDLLGFIATFSNPSDPNELVADLVEQFLPVPLAADQLTALKGVLIPGLPDFEWTIEYSDYLANPGDGAIRRSVLGKLNELVGAICGSADFQLY